MTAAKVVGIAQMAICHSPEKLTCLGLGSCVAVVMYEPGIKMGGIVHVLLPKAPDNHDIEEKYADTGTRKLFREMVQRGARKERLVAKLRKQLHCQKGPGGAVCQDSGRGPIRPSRKEHDPRSQERVCDRPGDFWPHQNHMNGGGTLRKTFYTTECVRTECQEKADG